jgi:hypothetical protein
MKLRYIIKLWWNRLWIRVDEFHTSLSLDAELASTLTESERKEYYMDLIKRREKAHEKTLH